MISKSTAHVTIDLDDVRKAGGVKQALTKWCEESDDTSCGIIGMEFATSGPGPGWSKTFGADDFASRAFEGGAMHYLDIDDGKLKSALLAEEGDEDATADMGGGYFTEGDWTDESVVRIECPDVEDALEHPVLAAEMARAVIQRHGPESDVAEWKKLVEEIKSAADAFDKIDADDFDGCDE